METEKKRRMVYAAVFLCYIWQHQREAAKPIGIVIADVLDSIFADAASAGTAVLVYPGEIHVYVSRVRGTFTLVGPATDNRKVHDRRAPSEARTWGEPCIFPALYLHYTPSASHCDICGHGLRIRSSLIFKIFKPRDVNHRFCMF